MIERKQEIFKYGVEVFAKGMCRRDRDAYIAGMVHENGYVAAAKQFFKKSAYLTPEDRDNLFEKDIVPPWMVEIFLEVEQQLFGMTLYDKQ